jgi:hypothetical protein
MAEKPKTFLDRIREREDEEEAESQKRAEDRELAARRAGPVMGRASAAAGILEDARAIQESGSTEKLHELLERVEPLIGQVHQLYNQYFTGVERAPPSERRKQLDQAMHMLNLLPKPTQALRFKCSTLHTRYMSFVEQWDRRTRVAEAGRKRS